MSHGALTNPHNPTSKSWLGVGASPEEMRFPDVTRSQALMTRPRETSRLFSLIRQWEKAGFVLVEEGTSFLRREGEELAEAVKSGPQIGRMIQLWVGRDLVALEGAQEKHGGSVGFDEKALARDAPEGLAALFFVLVEEGAGEGEIGTEIGKCRNEFA